MDTRGLASKDQVSQLQEQVAALNEKVEILMTMLIAKQGDT